MKRSFKTPKQTGSSAVWATNGTSGREEGDPWAWLGFSRPSLMQACCFPSPTPAQPRWTPGGAAACTRQAHGLCCSCAQCARWSRQVSLTRWRTPAPAQELDPSSPPPATRPWCAGKPAPLHPWPDPAGTWGFPGLAPLFHLRVNHLSFHNNNKNTLSTCFRQDTKNQQLGEEINGD